MFHQRVQMKGSPNVPEVVMIWNMQIKRKKMKQFRNSSIYTTNGNRFSSKKDCISSSVVHNITKQLNKPNLDSQDLQFCRHCIKEIQKPHLQEIAMVYHCKQTNFQRYYLKLYYATKRSYSNLTSIYF